MDLVETRIKKGLSQTAVAELVGTSQIYVSKIETGKSYPSESFRERFEAILGDVDWIRTRLKGLEVDTVNGVVATAVLEFIHSTAPQGRSDKIQFLRGLVELLEADEKVGYRSSKEVISGADRPPKVAEDH